MKCGAGAAKIYRLRWFKNMPGRFSGGRALESILRLYLRFRPKAGRITLFAGLPAGTTRAARLTLAHLPGLLPG
jgi:hypothetical protein